jgi:hypothetical protein
MRGGMTHRIAVPGQVLAVVKEQMARSGKPD